MPARILVETLSSVPSLDAVEKEVRDGLPGDQSRLARARKAEDYYAMRNRDYLTKREDETDADFRRRPKRFSRLTRVATRKLSCLYKSPPTREFQGDEAVSRWLQDAYAAAGVNARLQAADRAATLNHVAAIQVEATGDPSRPLQFWLWKGHEFTVALRDGDPVHPYAVTTIEVIPDPETPGHQCTRYRIWSAAERRTLLSEPWKGQRAPEAMPGRRRVDDGLNGASPYPGVLPFVFLRNEPPDCGFWEGGIGEALVELNEELDRGLCDVAEHVKAFLNPILWASGVNVASALRLKAGRPVHLESDESAKLGDNRIEPKLGYLQATLAVDAAWFDLKTYADAGLEELEVPLTVVRSDSSTDLSGVAIVAKSIPLYERTKERQPEWSEAEAELAGKSLAVAGLWYGGSGRFADSLLDAAGHADRLLCTWPEPKMPLPTAERDQADQWELDAGLTDPIEVLARRRGLTLTQAEELAREITERRSLWNSLAVVYNPS